jgi:hypothetical protein
LRLRSVSKRPSATRDARRYRLCCLGSSVCAGQGMTLRKALDRRHYRHRCLAGDPARTRRDVQRHAVGGRRVPARAGRRAADLGVARRPVWPAAGIRCRARHVYFWLPPLRAGSISSHADHLPGGSGRRRVDALRDLARLARSEFPGQAARRRFRRLGVQSPAWPPDSARFSAESSRPESVGAAFSWSTFPSASPPPP